MAWENCLATWANAATILTAAVAVLFFGQYKWTRWRRRVALENHLKAEKGKGDQGLRSIKHMMAALRLPEAEVMEAAFRSSRVAIRAKTDDAGFVIDLLFEYTGK